MTSADEYEADLREREDDPTPRGVARAILSAALDGSLFSRVCDRPISVLDVCAGYGCWASEFRRLAPRKPWPITDVNITGVEIDGRKREHLARWCDAVVINSFQEFAAVRDAGRRIYGGDCCADFDLAIGNPAFSLLAPKLDSDKTIPEALRIDGAVSRSMVAVLLRHAPAVLLLHTQQAFLRGRVGRAVWRRYTPARQWLIPGAVSFRADGKTDTRCYAASLWLRGHSGPTVVEMLPELGRDDLRWRVLPGTEEPSGDLPSVPSWKVAA